MRIGVLRALAACMLIGLPPLRRSPAAGPRTRSRPPTIDALGKRAFVLDTQQVAGSFPAKLPDPALLDAVRATAQRLRADITANTPAPAPPAQPTGGQGATTPGFPNTGHGSSSRTRARCP